MSGIPSARKRPKRHRRDRGIAVLLSLLLAISVIASATAGDGNQNTGNSAKSSTVDGQNGGLPDSVTLTRQQMRDRNIGVERAQIGTAESTISAPGTVQFVPDLVTRIGPRLPAKVVRLEKKLGDIVKEGDTIAVLDSVELGKAKARYLSLRAQFDLARDKYEREKRLVAKNISSKAELQQAEAEFRQAQADRNSMSEELRLYGLSQQQINGIRSGFDIPFSRFALTTPQAGSVEKLGIMPGQTLTAETTPIEIVDASRMRIVIQVFERNVERLRPGQHVVFSPDALPSLRFAGRVRSVARELDRVTRTLEVRATVSNPNDVLRAGMFGTARITIAKGGMHVVLPVDAIQTVNGRSIVFRPTPGEPGKFAVSVVKTGSESGDRVEILSGVSPGDAIVTRGSFVLMSVLTAGTRQDTD